MAKFVTYKVLLQRKIMRPLFIATCFGLVASPALAVEKINTPPVVKDRMQLEYLLTGSLDGEDPAQDNSQRHRVQIGTGVTDDLDIAISYSANHQFNDTESFGPGIRARYELTEQKDYWFASGVQARYTHRTDDGADDLHVRGLVQRRQGDWMLGGNLGLRREFGAQRRESVEMRVAMNALYQLDPRFNPGIEYFTVPGQLNDLASFSDQPHEVGPVFYGAWPISEVGSIAYSAGYYQGLTDAAPDHSTKIIVQYLQQF